MLISRLWIIYLIFNSYFIGLYCMQWTSHMERSNPPFIPLNNYHPTTISKFFFTGAQLYVQWSISVIIIVIWCTRFIFLQYITLHTKAFKVESFEQSFCAFKHSRKNSTAYHVICNHIYNNVDNQESDDVEKPSNSYRH